MTAVTGLYSYPIYWHGFRTFHIRWIFAAPQFGPARAAAHGDVENTPGNSAKDHSSPSRWDGIRIEQEAVAGMAVMPLEWW
ncbi:MAG TPA: hypothetical protein VGG45_03070 [Terracidiphilus sp.]